MEMLIQQLFFLKDRFTGTLVDHPVQKTPGITPKTLLETFTTVRGMHLLMARFIDAMLAFHMRQTAIGRLEGYRTFCTLIEDLTMFVLNVTLQERQ